MRQALGPGALGKPRGSGWRGRWEGGSGWGTHVNQKKKKKRFKLEKKKPIVTLLLSFSSILYIKNASSLSDMFC